jgi:phosphatidylserine decarboxylase
MVRPIAGLIARRIVCAAKPGDLLERGQKIGMIKFGSRTDMTLPVDDRIAVEARVGDKVRAGLSVIAKIAPTQEQAP